MLTEKRTASDNQATPKERTKIIIHTRLKDLVTTRKKRGNECTKSFEL